MLRLGVERGSMSVVLVNVVPVHSNWCLATAWQIFNE